VDTPKTSTGYGHTLPVMHDTERGVRIDLKALYVYPDFLALTLGDEQVAATNGQPFKTQRFTEDSDLIEYLINAVLRPARARARANGRAA
jgi:hypothetical protein